jgi:hypothetical protein
MRLLPVVLLLLLQICGGAGFRRVLLVLPCCCVLVLQHHECTPAHGLTHALQHLGIRHAANLQDPTERHNSL